MGKETYTQQLPPLFLGLALIAGCHHAKAPAPVTQADVDAAQRDAQHEIDQARVEAKKDVRSAAKINGADSPDVARAKATGTFDLAMAHADGDHKIALEKCLLLNPSAQPACKNQADVDYETATAAAKASRASQQQP